MVLNWKKTEGSVYPERLDASISKKYVYIRVNPKKVGNLWEYDEAIVSQEEYLQNPDFIEQEVVAKENSAEAIIALIAETVKIDERPNLEMAKMAPPKEGFLLVRKYIPEEHRIVWVYEADPDYVPISGSYLHPIEWTPGMLIVAGVSQNYDADGWYIYNGLTQRCINDGSPESFDDKLFFEVL